jgi:hypothetical protein
MPAILPRPIGEIAGGDAEHFPLLELTEESKTCTIILRRHQSFQRAAHVAAKTLFLPRMFQLREVENPVQPVGMIDQHLAQGQRSGQQGEKRRRLARIRILELTRGSGFGELIEVVAGALRIGAFTQGPVPDLGC